MFQDACALRSKLCFTLLLVSILLDLGLCKFISATTNSPIASFPNKSMAIASSPYFSPNETEHIISVTVRIYSSTPSASIFYTLDGSQPTHMSYMLSSGAAIILDSFGEVIVKALAASDGYLDSAVAMKRYVVIERCQKPIISPNGGTFAGSVNVLLQSASVGTKIYYTLGINDGLVPYPNSKTSSYIMSGQKLLLNQGAAQKIHMYAMASKKECADSQIVDAVFNILPKVEAPIILPTADIFTISATLTFTCSTPSATIYFTTDGSDPTHTSLQLSSGGSIVIESSGQHTVKAFAIEQSMLPSDIVTKSFTILERTGSPVFHPAPGFSYIGDLDVVPKCSLDTIDGFIYYTLDGVSTPSLASSPRISCGDPIPLKAPGRYVLRLFATSSDRSPSAIVEGIYSLLRVPFEMFPANKAKDAAAGSTKIDLQILSVEKLFALPDSVTSSFSMRRPPGEQESSEENRHQQEKEEEKQEKKDHEITSSSASSTGRRVTGRLVVLANPLQHFSVLTPQHGVCGKNLSRVTSYGDDDQGFSYDYSSTRPQVKTSSSSSLSGERPLIGTLSGGHNQQQLFRKSNGRYSVTSATGTRSSTVSPSSSPPAAAVHCDVAMNGGFFNTTANTCFGNIVSNGRLVQASSAHNVNFGIRNGSFFVGYLSSVDDGFDNLVSGVGWLVRSGEAYISENLLVDHEDLSIAGSEIVPSEVMARSVIGHDSEGRLLLLQVNGQKGVDGMTLTELAEFAVELGFYAAVNVGSGDSSQLAHNGALISQPSAACGASSTPYSNSNKVSNYIRCEQPVSTVLCLHSAAKRAAAATETPTARPSLRPPSYSPSYAPTTIAPTAGATDVPSALPTHTPSRRPTWELSSEPTPSWWRPVPSPGDSSGSGSNDNNNNDDNIAAPSIGGLEGGGWNTNTTYLGRLSLVSEEMRFYQGCTFTLSALLTLSLLAHMYIYMRSRQKRTTTLHREKYVGMGPGSSSSGSEIAVSYPSRVNNSSAHAHGLSPTSLQGYEDFDGGEHENPMQSRSIHNSDNLTRSAFNLSSDTRTRPQGGRNWQEELGAMQFTIDSDSDEGHARGNSSSSGGGRKKRGGGDTETIELYSKYLPQNNSTSSDIEASYSKKTKKRYEEAVVPSQHNSKSTNKKSAAAANSKRGGGRSGGGGGLWGVSAAAAAATGRTADYRQVGDNSSDDDSDGGASRHGDDDLNPFQSRR